MDLSSDAFTHGRPIPRRHSCEGDDVSPPLSWSKPPAGTRAFALLCEDPDAPGGVFTHWLLYDLPADRRALPAAIPPEERPAAGGCQGRNSFGRVGYGGPCPPAGPAHRYYFRLYALDGSLGLPPGAGREQLLAAMKDRVLGKASCMGRYGKARLGALPGSPARRGGARTG